MLSLRRMQEPRVLFCLRNQKGLGRRVRGPHLGIWLRTGQGSRAEGREQVGSRMESQVHRTGERKWAPCVLPGQDGIGTWGPGVGAVTKALCP